MSSHHFVKEGQEPILIVGNGEMCSYRMLADILEWSPKIVALDGAFDKLIQMQVTPDVAIGDFDSIQTRQHASVQFIHIPDQNNTDLEKAINYFVKQGNTSFTLIGCTGKRLDHTINNMMSLANFGECDITLYDNYSRLILLKKSFSKHYKKGQKISLVPLPNAKEITTSNLLYPLDKETLALGLRSGTSNQVKEDGIVSIRYTAGLLCLIESQDEV